MGQHPHACVASQVMGKEAARAFPIKRNNRGRAAHFTPSLRLLQSWNRRPLSSSSSPPSSSTIDVLPPSSALLLLAAAMAPKSTKGKGVAKDAGTMEQPESKLVARRVQLAYFRSTVDVFELRDSFKSLWGVKTGG